MDITHDNIYIHRILELEGDRGHTWITWVTYNAFPQDMGRVRSKL